MSSLRHKNFVLGITGGIAAYKSAELVRCLRKAGAEVRVVMTEGAKSFITPLTMQALSGHRVLDDLLDVEAEAAMGHIEMARWAHGVIIAPATANCLARLAQGRADDLLTTLCLASKAPIFVAPAMNHEMWKDKATQDNVLLLKKHGKVIIDPTIGEQACGEVGVGRMQEPEIITEKLEGFYKTNLLDGLKVVITAGPTQEPIDPVRFLSNHSSGKMGYALAQAAYEAGADVFLISGPVGMTPPPEVTCIKVQRAQEMLDAVLPLAASCDVFISAAAVADYAPVNSAIKKIPCSKDNVTLELVKNPDILAIMAAQPHEVFCVGFAAQTEEVEAKAREKLKNKCIDMIIANEVDKPDRGFHSDDNAATALWPHGQKTFSLQPKRQLAQALIACIAERMQERKA